MDFDAAMTRMSATMLPGCGGRTAVYYPPQAVNGEPVSLTCSLGPIPPATTSLQEGYQDEFNVVSPQGFLLDADLGGVTPVREGIIKFTVLGDQWVIAEKPTLEAGVWTLELQSLERWRLGGRRVNQ